MKITNNTPYALSCRYDVTNAEIIIDSLDLAHPTPSAEAIEQTIEAIRLWTYREGAQPPTWAEEMTTWLRSLHGGGKEGE